MKKRWSKMKKREMINDFAEAVSWYAREYGAMFVNQENLRAKCADLEQMLAAEMSATAKLRDDLATLQLALDTKTDELEALQVATCAEVTELKETITFNEKIYEGVHAEKEGRLEKLEKDKRWLVKRVKKLAQVAACAEVAELKAQVAGEWVPVLANDTIPCYCNDDCATFMEVSESGKNITTWKDCDAISLILPDTMRICRKAEEQVAEGKSVVLTAADKNEHIGRLQAELAMQDKEILELKGKLKNSIDARYSDLR